MLRTIGSAAELAVVAQSAYRRVSTQRWAAIASAQYPVWHADALSATAQPGALGSEGGNRILNDRSACEPAGCGFFVGHHTRLAPAGMRAFSASRLRAEGAKASDSGETAGENAKQEAEVKGEQAEEAQSEERLDARSRLLVASLKHVVAIVTLFPSLCESLT